MKLIKCDMCGQVIGDLQYESLQVGTKKYDLHKSCVRKLKEKLTGGEEVFSPYGAIWVTPTFTAPQLPSYPPYIPSYPYISPTVVNPFNQPYITCGGTNSVGLSSKFTAGSISKFDVFLKS